MAEETWSVPNGKIRIYGSRNFLPQKKNDRAILYVHGLSGWRYDHAATVMAQSFAKKGYDILRISLYYWEKDARKISDADLAIHGQDITAVAQYFKKHYSKLFACGHSYGTPSLLHADTSLFNALAFWDGTTNPSHTQEWMTEINAYTETPHGWLLNWGREVLKPKKMIAHSATLDAHAMQKLSAACQAPTLIVEAEKSILRTWPYHYRDWLTVPNKTITIKGTAHCFHEEGTTQPLLRATKKWFDLY